tara:strand:- start:559 stop:1713 length:1155 start_codon:yes stop_codon:yes gene_type:complete
MSIRKNIAILGSTGSIGTQALEVISEQPDMFQVEVLTANKNSELLIKQAIKHKPNAVVIVDDKKYSYVNSKLKNLDIKVFSGNDALSQVVEMSSVDLVLTALVGYAGLKPTINAIKSKKDIALANKEVLVVAGEMITKMAKKNNINILPVDSEHSAIFQCLTGEYMNPIEKIILTASGGPFRGFSKDALRKVSKKDALKHPNWEMGQKITIDSATMMNKGLEVIEAKWLFNLDAKQIEVVVHPESIIHSLVCFEDGSMKAQLGLPDMRCPIQYAFSYPKRLKNNHKRFNFSDYPTLNFEKPDTSVFECLRLSYESMVVGGNAPCVLNAANEIAVQAFLDEKINFLKIPKIVSSCLEKTNFVPNPTYDDYVSTDEEVRKLAKDFI